MYIISYIIYINVLWLLYHAHISPIFSIFVCIIGIFMYIIEILNIICIYLMYSSCISYVLYFSPIYLYIILERTTNSTLIDKVQKIQNFAMKTADGKAKKFDHATPLYEEFKWLLIKGCITLSFATSVFKHRINTYPGHLPLPTVSTVTQSTTRQQHNLYVPRTNTDTGARAP